nr:MAG TPA: hypothetical protein [Caudoviricetes sp.]
MSSVRESPATSYGVFMKSIVLLMVLPSSLLLLAVYVALDNVDPLLFVSL